MKKKEKKQDKKRCFVYIIGENIVNRLFYLQFITKTILADYKSANLLLI